MATWWIGFMRFHGTVSPTVQKHVCSGWLRLYIDRCKHENEWCVCVYKEMSGWIHRLIHDGDLNGALSVLTSHRRVTPLVLHFFLEEATHTPACLSVGLAGRISIFFYRRFTTFSFSFSFSSTNTILLDDIQILLCCSPKDTYSMRIKTGAEKDTWMHIPVLPD